MWLYCNLFYKFYFIFIFSNIIRMKALINFFFFFMVILFFNFHETLTMLASLTIISQLPNHCYTHILILKTAFPNHRDDDYHHHRHYKRQCWQFHYQFYQNFQRERQKIFRNHHGHRQQAAHSCYSLLTHI